MKTRWRRVAVVTALVVVTASGWAYSFVVPRSWRATAPEDAAGSAHRPPDPVQLWHGRVTKVRDATKPDGRIILVEYPVWNVYQKKGFVARMSFWVRPGTVTARRTGQPGELAVGQRVSVLWSGPVLQKNPPYGQAQQVVIEEEAEVP